MEKENKGVTLIALSITIVVLLILAGISISGGTDAVKKANLEELKTNMLLVKAKAKEYVEEANFKLGIKTGESYTTEKINEVVNFLNEKSINDTTTSSDYDSQTGDCIRYCELTTEDLKGMGLKNVKSDEENGKYIIKYDFENATVEVYNTKGYNGKHSLTDIEKEQ